MEEEAKQFLRDLEKQLEPLSRESQIQLVRKFQGIMVVVGPVPAPAGQSGSGIATPVPAGSSGTTTTYATCPQCKHGLTIDLR